MIKSFRHSGLRQFFESGRMAGIRVEHSKRLRVILARLNASSSPRDVALPGLRLHPLKGAMSGFWAVDVSGNWRVIFAFEGEHVVNVDYLDYH